MKLLFSHDSIRPSQQELVELVQKGLQNRKHVLAHAPTGLGKTAATLCPAVSFAMEKDLTVVFLTSRHTQHKIVLDTVRDLKKKHDLNITATSLIGKRWMCAQEGADLMRAGDFTEYCKSLVEAKSCTYFTNAREEPTFATKNALHVLQDKSPQPVEQVISHCKESELCPYEMALQMAEKSTVIIADYFYVFHPHIREAFFAKIRKGLGNVILVVDEAHNLPSRVRDVMTSKLTTRGIALAVREAKKYQLDDIGLWLTELDHALNQLAGSLGQGNEKTLRKEGFLDVVNKIKPVSDFIEELASGAEVVKEEQQTSHLGRVASFLQEWQHHEGGYARILQKDDDITLTLRCLDPALLTQDVFDQCYSAVLMSGTLTPTEMYRDLFGVHPDDVLMNVFPSPFPEKNRLPVIVPKTTTKFSMRSEEQYKRIGQISAQIANSIPGSVILFFPSYTLRNQVYPHFMEEYAKTTFQEMAGMTKEQKQDLLDRFVTYKEAGAALLAVAAGSFGEGVDLPGVLKGVIVIGLPLDRPDLETTELIEYFDRKFGKGWEYGYTLPAMTRCIQNAGRCIRTEKDRGVLVFLDERYAWPRYKNCFPPDWDIRMATDLEPIEDFFQK